MKIEQGELSEFELDRLLDQAKAQDAPVSDDLMARILADAEREIPPAPAPMPTAAQQPQARGGFLKELFAQIGGTKGVAGLAMAGVMGITFGIGDFGLQDIATQAFGFEIMDYDISDMYADYSLGDS